MNEANRLEDIVGPAGADWRERVDAVHARDEAMEPKPAAEQSARAVPRGNETVEPVLDDSLVRGFCGYLTADLPELHAVHPQKVADSWERFKARVAGGFAGLDFGQHENGDGT